MKAYFSNKFFSSSFFSGRLFDKEKVLPRLMGMIETKCVLVLASGSAIRRQVLMRAGLSFEVKLPQLDEEAHKANVAHLPFEQQALALALLKGKSVSSEYPDSYVIAADQICALDEIGQIFSKPGSFDQAKNHLQALRGRTHTQNSGVCLLHRGAEIWTHTQRSVLTMRDLSDEEIEAYLALDEPLAACGAYQLEGHAKHLFSQIEGNDDAILGLPLTPLLSKLYDLGLIAMKVKK